MLDAYDDCVDVECGLDAVEGLGVETLEPESSDAGFVGSDGPGAINPSPRSDDRVRVGSANSVDSTRLLR